jgi:hypothetical protein
MLKIKLLSAIVGLVVTLGLLVYVASLPEHYREQGRNEVKAEYEAASQTALNKRLLENAQLAFEYQAKSRQMIKDYEDELEKKDAEFNARLANDKRDGLRFKTACTATTRKTDSETPKGNNAEIEYRLPQGIENGIFGIIGKCNAVQDRLNLIIDKANELNLGQ